MFERNIRIYSHGFVFARPAYLHGLNIEVNMMTLSIHKLLLSLYLLIGPQPVAADDFYLTPGQNLTIRVQDSAAIRVKGRNVIHIDDRASSLRVTGQELGSATIHIGAQVHHVYVLPKSQIEFFQGLKELLQSFMGLKADWQNGQIIVGGQL
jgi:hypothetical protein